MLPNFIILGAARSGTTSLVRYLQQHPEILMNKRKDTNFFAYNEDDPGRTMWGGRAHYQFPVKNIEVYKELFETDKEYEHVGECSASYLVSKYAPVQIKEILGNDVKFIVILRNPVERAHSDFLRRKVKKEQYESKDFYENPLQKNWIQYGFYSKYLNEYFKLFDRDNFHIMIFEEFINNTHENMVSLYKFLGVNNDIKLDYRKYNAGGVPKSTLLNKLAEKFKGLFYKLLPEKIKNYAKELYRLNYDNSEELSESVYNELMALYREDINNLENMLDRSLEIWYE